MAASGLHRLGILLSGIRGLQPRRVYRHTYTVGKLGHKRKPLEKSIIGDFVFLVPGTKFWPNGTGWPNGTSGGVTMARSRTLSV